MASSCQGDVCCHGFDIGHGIRHRDRKSHLSEHRQIGQVVPDKGRLFPLDSPTAKQLPECSSLLRPRHLKQLFDPQLGRPQCRCLGAPAAEPDDRQAGCPKEYQAQAILDVEALELDTRTSHRADEDSIVGQYAINIEADQTHPPCGRCAKRLHTLARPQISSVCPTSSAKPSSGH